MNEYVDPVGSITVSIPEICWFIWAICSSFSKSDHRPQPLHDHRRADISCHVDGEGLHRDDTDVFKTLDALGDAFHPGVDGQQRLGLARIAQHGHDDLVEQPVGAFDDFQVPVVERIEGSREQRCRHRPSSGSASGTGGDFTATVTSVPP